VGASRANRIARRGRAPPARPKRAARRPREPADSPGGANAPGAAAQGAAPASLATARRRPAGRRRPAAHLAEALLDGAKAQRLALVVRQRLAAHDARILAVAPPHGCRCCCCCGAPLAGSRAAPPAARRRALRGEPRARRVPASAHVGGGATALHSGQPLDSAWAQRRCGGTRKCSARRPRGAPPPARRRRAPARPGVAPHALTWLWTTLSPRCGAVQAALAKCRAHRSAT
jgi:hypothetical protein